MTTYRATKHFDDRSTDFASGKKVSPPMAERRLCDCCGQRIVKGWFTTVGTVGEDCEDVLIRASRLATFADFVLGRERMHYVTKPAMLRFVQASMFTVEA